MAEKYKLNTIDSEKNEKIDSYTFRFFEAIRRRFQTDKKSKIEKLKQKNSAFNSINKQVKLKKEKEKSSVKNIFIFILFIFAIITSYLFFNTYYKNKKEFKRFSVFSTIDYKKKLNVLIIGTDVVRHKSSRTDTIIVANIDKINKKINFISIPRDTKVVLNNETRKINSVYSNYGINGLKDIIKSLLSVNIDSYIKVDLQGFTKIIDILGGVVINIDRDMKYDDYAGNLHIDFKKGIHKLDGLDAMRYIRYRDHTYGDLGRINRQQKFLKAILHKFLEIKTYFKLPELVGVVLKYIDTDMSLNMVLQIINKLFSDMNDKAKLKFMKLPGKPIYINNISFFEANKDKILKIKELKEYRDEK